MRLRILGTFLLAAIPLAVVALPAVASSAHAGAPSIQILSPSDQAAVGSTFKVRVKVTGFTLRPDLIGRAPTPGMGHYQILVDGVYNNASGDLTGLVKNVTPGRHQIMVILTNNDHSLYKIPATSSIIVQIGPSIQITSPRQGATVGSSFTLRVKVSGFTLNGSDIGHKPKKGEGHWHVLVDGTYVSASAGATAQISGLTPGPHMIEAQLANNDHGPLTPPVYYDLFVVVGGAASSTGTPSAPPVTNTPGTPSSTSTPSAAPATSTPGAPSSTGTQSLVIIQNYAFSPAALTIPAGTTVTWVNKDSVTHTATGDGNTFDSGGLDQNQRWSYTFTKPGTYTYFCAVHPNMKGTLIVQ